MCSFFSSLACMMLSTRMLYVHYQSRNGLYCYQWRTAHFKKAMFVCMSERISEWESFLRSTDALRVVFSLYVVSK